MARPLRIEFPGAVYHVTSRGDRQETIFHEDIDRCALLELIGEAMARFDACAHAWCLMGNHFHLVVQTARPNLSRLMRHVNGVYTQRFNRRHGKAGHVFQGRFKAVLVDTESYLLQACRYVELNPVRAGLVADPLAWAWSSARARVGIGEAPAWLAPHPFGPGDAVFGAYRHFLNDGLDDNLWASGLRQQIYLGPPAFVERMQARSRDARDAMDARTAPKGVPHAQLRSAKPLSEWLGDERPPSAQAIRDAHRRGGWPLTAIARHLGISVATASRRLRETSPGSGLVSCSQPALDAKNET